MCSVSYVSIQKVFFILQKSWAKDNTAFRIFKFTVYFIEVKPLVFLSKTQKQATTNGWKFIKQLIKQLNRETVDIRL